MFNIDSIIRQLNNGIIRFEPNEEVTLTEGECALLIKSMQAELRVLKQNNEILQCTCDGLEQRLDKSVELPCKIGDTVYILEEQYCCTNPDWSYMAIIETEFEYSILDNYKLNKTVFITHEEAEKCIRKHENNE